ncbi:flagellar biosynthesis anti-sigma factor FlgM [Ramlibacter humi]|uniref:Negative regulator of flagellin synthesis n=1 Tax=Ramlibacter humi TaxID=2530451 RepID=A0A4Z0CAK0_9BURK|nr:flagellar biosynthesis anti-sigma factor FlgM [Ramlibacter humi]TFZ08371.1 flagellar biosynthesis anti-sigma factor FlgM [Ramlibacter humi]
MKIGSTHDLTPAAPAAGSSRPAAPVAPLSATPAVDTADVSPAGAALVRAAGGSDFDQAKVDAVRKAISEGRFTVNAGAIADQLISDATALLSPRSAG